MSAVMCDETCYFPEGWQCQGNSASYRVEPVLYKERLRDRDNNVFHLRFPVACQCVKVSIRRGLS